MTVLVNKNNKVTSHIRPRSILVNIEVDPSGEVIQCMNVEGENESAILKSFELNWTGPGVVTGTANKVITRKKRYTITIEKDAMLVATSSTGIAWYNKSTKDHAKMPPIKAISALGAIRVSKNSSTMPSIGPKCAVDRAHTPADSGANIPNIKTSVTCITELKAGTHVIEFIGSGWSEHKSVPPVLLDGRLSYVILAK